MGWKSKSWILIGMLVCLATASSYAQVATTQIADTVFHADGTPAAGSVLISWPAFTTSTGQAIAPGSTSVTLGAGGALTVNLTPNAGAIPIGTYYTTVLHLDDGSVSRQYWVVPASSAPVKIAAIESSVLPTAVAMQTVSKAYVDNAIAAAVTGHPQDSSSPYVLKTGDTMTGPLSLPGDPVTANNAADKNYVDTNIAALNAGLAQKVSTQPTATQTVVQPAGTDLQVNDLNQVLYASQYATTGGRGGDGISNALGTPDCATGCDVQVEHNYSGTTPALSGLNPRTHLIDRRGGSQLDSFKDPLGPQGGGASLGEQIQTVSTIDASTLASGTPAAIGLAIDQQALAGGSNLYPSDIETPPYFKMAYGALSVAGTYNTQGQHTLAPQNIECFGVGDCLFGSLFVYASGGARDAADEGAHLHDTVVQEDPRVFRGACITGCTPGSTSVMIRQDVDGGTQGDGRFLIDTNPAKTISSQSTGGAIVGGLYSTPHASVQFSGTSFPVSVFLQTAQVVISQSSNMAPGTVTVPISTSGVPGGFATNTAAIGSGSGVACVTDEYGGSGGYYEMANYTVVDASHIQLTFNKPHKTGATLAFGGLCGYGIEQTVDTVNGVRQVFPVVGSYSPTALYYEALTSNSLGEMNQTAGYLNVNTPVATLTRSGGSVSVVTAGNLPYDLNGLTVTIAGAADSSFNGAYPITTTGPNTFTYSQAGANSSTSGGSVSYLTGGFVLYPMAEVLSVYDPAARYVDGLMTLAPNTVPWAANDTVEEPHFFQELITADTELYAQIVPRPDSFTRAGITYAGTNSGEMWGYTINNVAPQSTYIGYGGTHVPPEAAYEVQGTWRHAMSVAAGEQTAFSVFCNGHGCGNWNSNYDLFQLQSSAGFDTFHYDPSTSALDLRMRGADYSFAPSGFSAPSGSFGALAVQGGLASFHSPGHTAVAIGSGTPIELGDDAYLTAIAPAATPNAGMLISRYSNAGFASVDLVTGGNTGVGWSMQLQPGSADWILNDRQNGLNAIDCQPGGANACTFAKPVVVNAPVSATVYQGPATAPTGACSTVGWAFSQDGHASFCNGSSWTTKL